MKFNDNTVNEALGELNRLTDDGFYVDVSADADYEYSIRLITGDYTTDYVQLFNTEAECLEYISFLIRVIRTFEDHFHSGCI